MVLNNKMEEKKLKPMVRVGNTDIKGNIAIVIGLAKVKGVGHMFANAACKVANVDIQKKSGYLEMSEIEKLTDVIQIAKKYKLPLWLFNRRNDYETGEDRHILMGDLLFAKQQDVRRLQKIKSNRGLRHAAGLPLRGQRTQSNFRRNKGKAVGVKRKGGKSGRV